MTKLIIITPNMKFIQPLKIIFLEYLMLWENIHNTLSHIQCDTNFIFKIVTVFEFVYIFICITNTEKVCAKNLSGYIWTVGFVSFIYYLEMFYNMY